VEEPPKAAADESSDKAETSVVLDLRKSDEDGILKEGQ
jgi:hypothetical protein